MWQQPEYIRNCMWKMAEVFEKRLRCMGNELEILGNG